ncbi:CLUMA_CG016141, isoform A [Clunio marinus]|uniref:CLUMA_CG016141, isoform A n=1 Tax=Clunio marinus TaxID=568069 RepID=A0A1J1IS57_9DIPT|nr:CLUMA_CG016141, isoform A [Clunio marinus]
MADFFKGVMFVATTPFRVVKEVATHTVAGAATGLILVGGGIAKLIDDDGDIDVEEIWNATKKVTEKVVDISVDVAVVTTGVAAIVSTGGLAAAAVPAGIAGMCKSGSSLNSSFEKAIDYPEEDMDHLLIAVNTIGLIGGSAGLLSKAAKASSTTKIVLEAVSDGTKLGTLPFKNPVLKFTPEYVKKVKQMDDAELAEEAAKFGLTVANFLLQMEKAISILDSF